MFWLYNKCFLLLMKEFPLSTREFIMNAGSMCIFRATVCLSVGRLIKLILMKSGVGLFRSIRKTAKSCCQFRCFCMSVCPRRTSRLPLDRFWWNLIFEFFFSFKNLLWKFKSNYNPARITGTLLERDLIFAIISRWILLTVGNFSGKDCRENQSTHFVFGNFSPKIAPFMR
jgi:hypothetical protein